MNTHDIELPPLPVPRTKTDGGIELFAEYSVREYTRAAIEPYKQRISELEAQLEAVGAGGVSAGQRLMTREAVGLQAPSVALLLKIKTYTAACAERLGQPEIDRRWADICSAARDYAAEQVELDRQRRGEPVVLATYHAIIDESEKHIMHDTRTKQLEIYDEREDAVKAAPDHLSVVPVYVTATEGPLFAAPQPAVSSRGEPVARVNDDGFIVETGLGLAPGTLLYTAPQPPEPVKVPSGDDVMSLASKHEAHGDVWADAEYRFAERDVLKFAHALLARYGQPTPTEPVGEIRADDQPDGEPWAEVWADLPAGTPLYTAPQPASSSEHLPDAPGISSEHFDDSAVSAEPVKVPSEDERAAQGLPPYSPRHLTEEEWARLTENGRRAWGKKPDEPEKDPPCET